MTSGKCSPKHNTIARFELKVITRGSLEALLIEGEQKFTSKVNYSLDLKFQSSKGGAFQKTPSLISL